MQLRSEAAQSRWQKEGLGAGEGCQRVEVGEAGGNADSVGLSSVDRKGAGKATVRLLLRGQLYTGRDVQERLKTDLASWQTPRPGWV